MSKPVNLNRFRKQEARADKKARADENAILHGLSKSERKSAHIEQTRLQTQHEGLKLIRVAKKVSLDDTN